MEEANRMPLPISARPRRSLVSIVLFAALCLSALCCPSFTYAAGEADLVLPDLNNPAQKFFGMTGHNLLMIGLVISLLGIVFGLVIYMQLKKLPVHRTMREVSDLI